MLSRRHRPGAFVAASILFLFILYRSWGSEYATDSLPKSWTSDQQGKPSENVGATPEAGIQITAPSDSNAATEIVVTKPDDTDPLAENEDTDPFGLPGPDSKAPAYLDPGEDSAQFADNLEAPPPNDPVSEKPIEPKPEAKLSPLPSPGVKRPSFDPDDVPDVDWSRFAYTQYVTNSEYLCNSVMILESLHRLGSLADRVMMYPDYMLPDAKATEALEGDGMLIIEARDKYNVTILPIEVQHRDTGEDATWADSYTKLLAWNLTQYDRVLAMDSDSTVLQAMDELFLLPPCPLACPRAFWLLRDDPPKRILSSQIMLLQPDTKEFGRIMDRVADAPQNVFDMELVNELYLDSAMILSHRPYNMLTAEMRSKTHELYLGSDREEWDAKKVVEEAKFVHFSDWPVPKPWIQMEDDVKFEMQPECVKTEGSGQEDCTDREIWLGFYEDFASRKQSICKTQLDWQADNLDG